MTSQFKRVQRTLAGVVLPFLFFSSSAHAQSTASLPETVVSASLIEQKIEDAIPTTVLIQRQDIERSSAVDLPTLLRQFAGIEVSQNGGLGTNASAFIRGAESRHTLVLLDGIPINNLNFNTTPLEAIPLFGIERIEIVRGNVSALYGSSAMGGVIQIVTRSDAPKDWAQARVEAGTNQTGALSAATGKILDNGLQLQAGWERMRTSGFNAIRQEQRSGTNPDRDGALREVAHAQISQRKDQLNWRFAVSETRLKSQYDSEFGPATQADESKYNLRNAYLSGEYDRDANSQIQWGWGHYTDRLNAFMTSDPYAVNNQKDQVRLGWRQRLSAQHTLTAGYEKTWDRIDSPTTAYTKNTRQSQGLRAGYHFNGESHVLQLNVRQDAVQGYDDKRSYYVGYQYFILPTLRLLASQSTGFLTPTFNDLYYPATTYDPSPGYSGCFQCYGGNVNLKPETSRSNEAGVQWGDERQHLRAVVFRNKYTNLIADNPDEPYNRINIGSASNQGRELTYRRVLPDGAVRLTWLSQNPVDDTSGTRLVKRAKNAIWAGYSHQMNQWQLETSYRYTSERMDRYRGADQSLAAYSVWDVSLSRPINKNVLWYGRIDNLTNKDYSLSYGYRTLGRSVLTGLRVSL